MVNQGLVTAVTSTVRAAQTLFFEPVRAITASSQHLASIKSSNRRVTGAFNLQQGNWFKKVLLTPNPRYRMPVFTLPGLRGQIPVQQQGQSYSGNFTPGINFNVESNCYMDANEPRISEMKRGETTAILIMNCCCFLVTRIVLAPFAFVFACAIGGSCCCFCALCYICSIDNRISNACAVALWAFMECRRGRLVRWYLGGSVQPKTKLCFAQSSPRSKTPALEAASWVQLLLNYQPAWWGYASLQWKWRLSSKIPSDMSGALAETSIADLELLALMAGMHLAESTLIETKCGEALTYTQHETLGTMAFYRSGRSKIHPKYTQAEIIMGKPTHDLHWLYHCIEARRLSDRVSSKLDQKYKGGKISLDGPEKVESVPSAISIERAINQLARKRTDYDAQLQYSCGSSMWIFSTRNFVRSSKMLQSTATGWSKRPCRVQWGPLAAGANSCSCLQCCRDWFYASGYTDKDHEQKSGYYFLPALKLESRGVVTLAGSPIIEVEPQYCEDGFIGPWWTHTSVEIKRQCYSQCQEQDCHCGFIAKLETPLDIYTKPSMDAALAALAYNTAWLSKVSSKALLKTSKDLLLDLLESPLPPDTGPRLDSTVTVGHFESSAAIKDPGALDRSTLSEDTAIIGSVLSYTEILLFHVRQHIGSTNIWDSPVGSSLNDFSPVVMGA